MKNKAFSLLLWMYSGAFFFVEYLGPKHGQVFLHLYVILFALFLFYENLLRHNFLPFRSGFWTGYLLAFFFLLIITTLGTSVYLDKDWYQVFRRVFYNSYFFVLPYIVFSLSYPVEKLIKQVGIITIVLLLMEMVSIISGVQLYTSSFVEISEWNISQVAAGGFRVVPLGVDIAVFAIATSLVMFGKPIYGKIKGHLLIVLISGIFIILLTFTRSFIAAVFLSVLLWFFFDRKVFSSKKFKAVSIMVIGIAGVFLVSKNLFHGVFFDGLTARFLRAAEVGDSWRYMELSQALLSISEHPLFGVGLGSRYTEVMALFADEGYEANANYDIHNMYAGILINYGIVGMVFFVAGVIAFYRLNSGGNIEGDLVQASKIFLTVGLLSGFFSGGYFNGQSAFWYALFMSYAIKMSSQEKIKGRVYRKYVSREQTQVASTSRM